MNENFFGKEKNTIRKKYFRLVFFKNKKKNLILLKGKGTHRDKQDEDKWIT
jgi:hypothetical protein